MKKAFNFLAAALFFLLTAQTQAQTVVGKWKTIDDETKQPKSIVEIYEQNGKYYGKIVKLFLDAKANPDPICDKCEDDRKNKKIVGMVIMTDMKKDGDEFSGGEICKPSNGKTYRCKMWLEGGKLMVRGYIGFVYKTQEWLREN